MFNFTDKKTAIRQERLPDPFLKPDGARVASAAEWEEQRVYLKEMLAHYLYGHTPPESGGATGTVIRCQRPTRQTAFRGVRDPRGRRRFKVSETHEANSFQDPRGRQRFKVSETHEASSFRDPNGRHRFKVSETHEAGGLRDPRSGQCFKVSETHAADSTSRCQRPKRQTAFRGVRDPNGGQHFKVSETHAASSLQDPRGRRRFKVSETHAAGSFQDPRGRHRFKVSETHAAGSLPSRKSMGNNGAIKETVRITCGAYNAISFDAVIIRPARQGRFPVFVWNQFADMLPCPVEEEVIRRGYAIAMFNRNQLAPDIMGCEHLTGQCVETYPDSDWRAMAIWGWGASRLVDYLLTTDYADPDRLITTGHSRGGKAALCSAIYDERFALCAAAGSGCGGAASLRFMGTRLGPGGACESLGDITKKSRYWYWFSDVCADYGNHEKRSTLMDEALLPFDLHFVRALIAPRPLISVDGLDDVWSNPYGITLSWAASEPVYQFLGAAGKNALFVREGGHAYSAADWLAVLNFCDNMLLGKNEAPLYKAEGAEQLCLDGLV